MKITRYPIYAPNQPYMFAIYSARLRMLFINTGTNYGIVIQLRL